MGAAKVAWRDLCIKDSEVAAFDIFAEIVGGVFNVLRCKVCWLFLLSRHRELWSGWLSISWRSETQQREPYLSQLGFGKVADNRTCRSVGDSVGCGYA